jgi:hypothetical protein
MPPKRVATVFILDVHESMKSVLDTAKEYLYRQVHNDLVNAPAKGTENIYSGLVLVGSDGKEHVYLFLSLVPAFTPLMLHALSATKNPLHYACGGYGNICIERDLKRANTETLKLAGNAPLGISGGGDRKSFHHQTILGRCLLVRVSRFYAVLFFSMATNTCIPSIKRDVCGLP